MLAVVFPPFAQRLENSVSRACWPSSISLGVWDPEGANHVPHLPQKQSKAGRGNCRTMQTVEKQVVLEENWQVLAVVFPPFA